MMRLMPKRCFMSGLMLAVSFPCKTVLNILFEILIF